VSPASRVQEEIHQSRPFSTPEQECLVSLLRTADVVRRRLTRVIAPRGITPQQYNVLRILRGAEPEGLPTLAIGQRMIEHAPGITRLLDRLVRKQLVDRGRTRSDQRCVVCRITRRGLDLLAQLDAPISAADRQSLGTLEGAQVGELIRLLDAVRAGDASRHETESKEESP
jgi:DNA-binding MarR family transcriptional regulator